MRDIGQGATRVQSVTLTNPQGFTSSDFTSSEILLQTWILAYKFTPVSALSINRTSSAISTTQFSLSITVTSDFSLEELAITAIMVNKTVLL